MKRLIPAVPAKNAGTASMILCSTRDKLELNTQGGEPRFSPLGNPHRVTLAGIASLILFLLTMTSASVLAATPQPEKLTVMLNHTASPDHAPLIIAAQQGFFKEQGLDVELLNPRSTSDSTIQVAEQKADIGITYEPHLITQIDHGAPLIRVGTLIDKPLNCLVVLNTTGVKSLSELKGRAIASKNSELTNAMVRSMLRNEGVSSEHINLIGTEPNLMQALLTQRITAASGLTRNMQIPMLEEKGVQFTTYFPEEHGIPTYSELVFVAHMSSVKDSRIPRFLAAIKKAVAYLDQHPQETWQQFIKQYPSANNTVTRNAWFTTMPYFAEEPADFDAQEWEKFAAFMHKNRLISKTQPTSRYAIIVR